MCAQAAFHLAHDFGINAQIFSNGIHFIVIQPSQAFFGATQVKEQLTLCLSGSHLNNTPVAQNIFVNFGFDPVHSKGYQAHATLRIKAFYGFHQTNIAFLNKVALWQTIAGIAFSDMYHKTQVRHNQLARSIQVFLVIQALSQVFLLLNCQDRDTGHGSYVGRQILPRYHTIHSGQQLHINSGIKTVWDINTDC